MTNSFKILTIHSFATHGMASLKVAMLTLGNYVLPVPSLYLTGLTNIKGIQKFQLPFEQMLMGSLKIARQNKQKLILYIGYLGSKEQAIILSEAIEEYRDIITEIIVDPVSGDHGKLYVPEEVVQEWPHLLEKADWALPNFTEVKYLSGKPFDRTVSMTDYVRLFKERFPNLSFIITSLPAGSKIGIHLHHQDTDWQMTHKKLRQHFGGSGDVFATSFIENFWIKKLSAKESVEHAAIKCLNLLENSLKKKSHDLLISV